MDSSFPNPETRIPNPPRAKRAYIVSDRVRAANSVPTEARRAARDRNLRKAWEQQRDPHRRPNRPDRLPRGRFVHGGYSKDLKHSAPLANEPPDAYDRLVARILELFPAPPHLERHERRIVDRIWRMRRLVGSRGHQEKLVFYDALFEAAALPGGLGLERSVELVERLAQVFNDDLDCFAERVERRGEALGAAMEGWRRAQEKAWRSKPRRRAKGGDDGNGENGGDGGDQDDDENQDQRHAGTAPLCPPLSRGEELARQWAKRPWALPDFSDRGAAQEWEKAQAAGQAASLATGQPSSPPSPPPPPPPPPLEVERYRRACRWHYELVLAAVVGKENVDAPRSPALERAVRRLAWVTRCRLQRVAAAIEKATAHCDRHLARYEVERNQEDPDVAGRDDLLPEAREFFNVPHRKQVTCTAMLDLTWDWRDWGMRLGWKLRRAENVLEKVGGRVAQAVENELESAA